MRLYCFCPKCKKEITINTRASDRFVLARKSGENFPLNCSHCGFRITIHVNDVKAEEWKYLRLLAGIIFIMISLLLLFFVKDIYNKVSILKAIGIMLFPFFVGSFFFSAIVKSNRKSIQYFNSKWFG